MKMILKHVLTPSRTFKEVFPKFCGVRLSYDLRTSVLGIYFWSFGKARHLSYIFICTGEKGDFVCNIRSTSSSFLLNPESISNGLPSPLVET